MQNGYEFNSLEFISAGGAVAILVAVILLVMSVASWYVMIRKTVQMYRANASFTRYVNAFWQADNLGVAAKIQSASAAATVAQSAIAAATHHHTHTVKSAAGNQAVNVSLDEFVARSMNSNIADEAAHLEGGLTVLASVGSVSPFVGLFGTVWGIYHALATISLSGQATLDKVAGPVGEALIMTALGLAVAIPAVLAYNALIRSNRNLMHRVEQFAGQLHTLIVTGAVLQPVHNKAHAGNAQSKEQAQQAGNVFAVAK